MKRIIILIFIFIAATTKAQHPYIPIPEDSAVWVTLGMSKKHGNIAKAYYVSRTEGLDTVIGGKSYFIYFGEWGNLYVPPPPPKQTMKIVGEWLRQDTMARKVWLDQNHSVPADEKLLYDFTLQKGDTINDTNSMWFYPQRFYPNKAWVDELDSVYWADDAWRYRWWIKAIDYLTSDTMTAIMIEGMGFTTHFYWDPFYRQTSSQDNYWQIGCFGVKNQWLYSIPNPWNADCSIMVDSNVVPVGIEELHFEELSKPLLYPNPVSSYGDIHFNHYAGLRDEYHYIIAYNSTGQKVLAVQVKPGEKIPLQHYNLNAGIYFFIVNNKENLIIYKQRIMVH